MAVIDWDYWRLRYVSSDDLCTLEALSQEPGAPALSTLKKRSRGDSDTPSWPEQRKQFRNQADTLAHSLVQNDAVAGKAAKEVARLVDTAEMLGRHQKVIHGVLSKGLAALKELNPRDFRPNEALSMIKWAVEAERLLEGLATARTDLDLTVLSDEQLDKIIDGSANL